MLMCSAARQPLVAEHAVVQEVEAAALPLDHLALDALLDEAGLLERSLGTEALREEKVCRQDTTALPGTLVGWIESGTP